MSGSCISSGKLTKNNDYLIKLQRLMEVKIDNLTILIIPLTDNETFNKLRFVGCIFQAFFHPRIFSTTFSHFAVQLNMENGENIIMEYGQYLNNKKEIEYTKDVFQL